MAKRTETTGKPVLTDQTGRSGVAGRRQGAGAVVLAASIAGLAAFLYPFILPAIEQAAGGRVNATAHAADAPLVFALVAGACLVAIAFEISQSATRRGEAAKIVALLGALVAIDAALRLAPSFLGATPVFLLIVLAGVVFGPSFGFAMGALTLLVSAFLTGGVGPWLPYQMLGAGWVGMTAGWLPQPRGVRWRLAVIAGFAGVWGLLFGALLNLWFWPYAAPGADGSAIAWEPGLGVVEALQRYLAFYLTTSLAFDAFRAVGNVVLVVALGAPLLGVLERYRRRFGWVEA